VSNYTPIIAYGTKDSLSHGDPNKVIRGSQLDAELSAIATAVATKQDTASLIGTAFGVNYTDALVSAGTLNYYKQGPVIHVYSLVDYFGNSNLASWITITSLPSAIRPSTTIKIPANMASGPGGGTQYGNVSLAQVASNGVATVFYGGSLPASTLFGFAKGSIIFSYVQV
jgi:hypothetical protein